MQIEYKNIDPKLIVTEIRNGRSLESVQKLFGIKFKSEVRDLYLRGLMDLGEIPQLGFKNSPSEMEPADSGRQALVRRRGKREAASQTVVKTTNFRTIGQSGSITLNRALLVEQLGFQIGDFFEIYREDDRVILQKAPAHS